MLNEAIFLAIIEHFKNNNISWWPENNTYNQALECNYDGKMICKIKLNVNLSLIELWIPYKTETGYMGHFPKFKWSLDDPGCFDKLYSTIDNLIKRQ